MITKRISNKECIHVTVNSAERALEEAMRRAIDESFHKFKICDYGHSEIVDDWERCCSDIIIEQTGLKMIGGMGGWSHRFTFETWCVKNFEEDEDCETEYERIGQLSLLPNNGGKRCLN